MEKWGTSVLKPVKPTTYPKLYTLTERRIYDLIVREPGYHESHYYNRRLVREKKAFKKLLNKGLIKTFYSHEYEADVVFPGFYTEKDMKELFKVKVRNLKRDLVRKMKLDSHITFADVRSEALFLSMDFKTIQRLHEEIRYKSIFDYTTLKARKLDKNRIELTFERRLDNTVTRYISSCHSNISTNLKLADYSVKQGDLRYDPKEDEFYCDYHFKAVFIYNPVWGGMKRIREMFRR